MNTLLFDPTDILFFKDGRPMSGSLAGNGAAWPLPTVTTAALHAALHRAGLTGAHPHVPGRSSQERDYSDENRQKNGRLFGCLQTAGPFPVCTAGTAATWFFPRPLDAGIPADARPSLLPLAKSINRGQSSLPEPLQWAVANTMPATKDQPKPWWSEGAWNAYLGTPPRDADSGRTVFKSDADFADTESTFGIGIDPATGTQDGERFYSAHYLRLREGWRLGCLAEANDRAFRDQKGGNDLVKTVFPNSGSQTPVIVGGQQRLCTVIRNSGGDLPLPVGLREGFGQESPERTSTWLVKWVLLTPAIFPAIQADAAKGIYAHPGGWLPNWVFLDWNGDKNEPRVSERNGRVLLKSGDTARRVGESGKLEPREAWRDRVRNESTIEARLIAALTGKPIPVAGYALDNGLDDRSPGPKSTHLAVPAGSVYYFECADETAAQKLAAALNWHGDGDATTIRNRRSTLMGEKGFGLGVCATWKFHDGMRPE